MRDPRIPRPICTHSNWSKSVYGGSEGQLRFPVVYQDGIANFDAFVADTCAIGTLRRSRDECIHLVLGFAAKRTPGDFILVALGKHKPIMPTHRRKSRSVKVQIGTDESSYGFGSSEASKDAVLGAERLLAFGLHFSQIELRQRWFAPILARYYHPLSGAAPVFFPSKLRVELVVGTVCRSRLRTWRVSGAQPLQYPPLRITGPETHRWEPGHSGMGRSVKGLNSRKNPCPCVASVLS